MKHKLFLTAAVLAASTNFATAQSASDWTGFYAGVTASSISGESTAGAPFVIASGSGAGLGIMLGYNYAISSNFVVGGELTYSLSSTHLASVNITFEDQASVRLRGGYVMGKTMLYGAVGYASQKVVFPGGAPSYSGNGAIYALGVEHMINPHITIRAEYSHAQYDYGVALPPLWEDSVDKLTIGVAYKF